MNISPEMRRFNEVVERVDATFHGKADRLGVDQLIGILAAWPANQTRMRAMAVELEQASAALNGDAETGCEHRWRHQGYAQDGTGFVRCSKCGKTQEL